MLHRRRAPFLAMPLILAACVRCETAPAPGELVVMTYNLQTLFDPVDHGGEYEEYRVSTGAWGEAPYRKRLASLSSAVLAASFPGGADRGPDVLVVQEAENERVLRDLAEALGGYPYVVSSPDEEAVLSCGVLSRFRPLSVRAHRVRKPDDGPASVPRFLLEVELDVGGRRLVVVASHWKSKLGGAAETEPERRAAAAFVGSLVASRLAGDPSAAVVAAGDFNESPDEYERAGRAYPTALMPPGAGPGPWLLVSGDRGRAGSGDGPLVLFCPWEEAGGYSYRYEGREERIDQLLMSPGLASGEGPFRFEAFSAEPPAFLVAADGAPLGWSPRLGSGYSDHLPVRARLSYSP